MDRTALYCGDCMRFIQYADERGEEDDPIVWVRCDWCLAGKPDSLRGERACLQCGESFTPARDPHVFHSDRCRARYWREHRNGQAAA